jgi:CARDB
MADAIAIVELIHSGGLASGANYTQSANFTMPTVADGTIGRFIVVTDVYRQVTEANGETDNAATSAPVVVTHPDLAVSGVTAPSTGLSGSPVTISWTVTNNGTAAIIADASWTDQVFVASGTTFDGTQSFLGSVVESGPLAAGGSYQAQLQVNLPSNLVPGNYHILVLTNASNAVNEAGNTSNNLAASAAIAVTQRPLPDLQISNLSVTPSSSIESGDQLTIAWNALNAGSGVVNNSFYSHVVVVNTSTGATLADAEVYYNVGSNGSIAANGGTAAQQYVLALPDGANGVGQLKITVTADTYAQVYEGSGTRTDNSATTTVSSTQAPLADLVVNGLNVGPANPNSGDTLTIGWSTTNNGAAAVNSPFSDEVIVTNQSTGVVLSDQIIAYDLAANGPIAPGAGAVQSTTVTLPAGQPGVGTILVKVIADTYNQVPELVNNNRTDNTATRTVTSTLNLYPDLSVSNISAPANANAGDTVTLSYTVTNNGTGTASGAWAEQISLSSDGTAANAIAVEAESEINQSIAPGASVQRTVSLTLPSVLDGAQYFMVTADSLDSLIQLNNVNHTGVAASPIVIVPGLTLTLGQNTVADNAGSPACSAVLTRSGDATSALTVNISADQAGLVLPATVTIPAGQDGASFQVGAVNPGVTGPTLNINITASATGYQRSTAQVQETNVNTPALTLMGPASVDRNAGTVAVTLERNTPTTQALTVNLSVDLTFFVDPPPTVTFAVGQSMMTINVPLVDDGNIYGNLPATLTAAATGFTTATTSILVFDTDVPTLTATLGQSTVSEAAGTNATTLTITRSVVTSQALNLAIGSNPMLLQIGSSAQIAAGQASVTVPVGVIDMSMPTSDTMSAGFRWSQPIPPSTFRSGARRSRPRSPSLAVSVRLCRSRWRRPRSQPINRRPALSPGPMGIPQRT